MESTVFLEIYNDIQRLIDRQDGLVVHESTDRSGHHQLREQTIARVAELRELCFKYPDVKWMDNTVLRVPDHLQIGANCIRWSQCESGVAGRWHWIVSELARLEQRFGVFRCDWTGIRLSNLRTCAWVMPKAVRGLVITGWQDLEDLQRDFEHARRHYGL